MCILKLIINNNIYTYIKIDIIMELKCKKVYSITFKNNHL